MSDKVEPSLIYGTLNHETFTDFVKRLRHDRKHNNACTADPIWSVQVNDRIYNIEEGYEHDGYVIIADSVDEHTEYLNPEACITSICDSDDKGALVKPILKSVFSQSDEIELYLESLESGNWSEELESSAIDAFLELSEDDQLEAIAETSGFRVCFYRDNYVTDTRHFTRAAAEAYVERKSHDLCSPRIYVESQYWSPEWKAIVEGMLSGQIAYVEQDKAPTQALQSLFDVAHAVQNPSPAQVIKAFFEYQAGAIYSGNVNKNNPTVAESYRAAQYFLKDHFGEELGNIDDVFGKDVAEACGRRKHA